MHSTKALSAARRGMVVLGIAGGITLLGAGFAASSAAADEIGLPTGIVASDRTSGEDGVLSGNQVDADVGAPVDASGNQVTVIGDGNESAGDGEGPRAEASPSADVDHTDGEDGLVSGNQVDADVEAPVDVSGNQVTVIGDGNTSGGASSESGACGSSDAGSGDSTSGPEGDTTSGEDGTGSGNQLDVGPSAPVDASDNQVTLIGDGNQSGDDPGDGNDPGEPETPGDDGPGDEGPGDGSDGEDGEGGDDGQVAGSGSGGPGRPATGALSGLGSLDGAPSTVLPQTGIDAASTLAGLTGLFLLIAGAALLRPRGRRHLAS